jgi:DNA-binding NarL/FixJ family response regulator
VARIRAVMVTTPAMLSDLIASLAPMRLDIVAELSDRRDLLANPRQLRPDLVVIGLAAVETDAAVRALQEGLPATKFLALSADGRSILGYLSGMRRVELTDAPPQALIDFLRGSEEK